jgi:hypothetical protein
MASGISSRSFDHPHVVTTGFTFLHSDRLNGRTVRVSGAGSRYPSALCSRCVLSCCHQPSTIAHAGGQGHAQDICPKRSFNICEWLSLKLAKGWHCSMPVRVSPARGRGSTAPSLFQCSGRAGAPRSHFWLLRSHESSCGLRRDRS